MELRCAILGQSNSIKRDGFLYAVLNDPGIIVTRLGRLGASPSVIGPYFADDDFFATSDFCIIDLCVVDHSALAWSALDLYQIMQWVDWIGHKARKNGCQPIFVLIPPDDIASANPLLSVYHAIIRRNAYFYLDVRDLVAELAARDGATVASLYADGSHPGPQLSAIIGTTILAFLRGAARITYRPVRVTFPLKTFRNVHLADDAGRPGKVVEYRNSFMAMRGVRIEPGDCAVIRTGEIDALHGILVNAACCRSKVAIEGSSRVVKNLNLRPYGDSEFEARMLPVCTPLRDCNGMVSITLAAEEAIVGERSMEEMSQAVAGLRRVEIAALVVETGTRLVTYDAAWPELEAVNLRRYATTHAAGRRTVDTVLRAIAARDALERAGVAQDGPLRGHLDLASHAAISGWAQDEAHLECPVRLEILDNGAVIATVVAELYREDLNKPGVGSGRHGFVLLPARGLDPTIRHVIAVRRESDGDMLPGSPFILEMAPAGAREPHEVAGGG